MRPTLPPEKPAGLSPSKGHASSQGPKTEQGTGEVQPQRHHETRPVAAPSPDFGTAHCLLRPPLPVADYGLPLHAPSDGLPPPVALMVACE